MTYSRRGECILVSLGCGCLALSGLGIVGLVALICLWGSAYSTDPPTVERAAQQALAGSQAMPGCHAARLMKVGRFYTSISLGELAKGDSYAYAMTVKPNSQDPTKIWKANAPLSTGGELDTQFVDLNLGGRHETVLRRVVNGEERFSLSLVGHGRQVDLQISSPQGKLDQAGLQHFLDGVNLNGFSTFASTQGDRIRYYRLKSPPRQPVDGVRPGMTAAQVEKILGGPPQQTAGRSLYRGGQVWVTYDQQGLVREVNGQSTPGVEFATKVETLKDKVEPLTFLDQVDRPGCYLRTEDAQVTRVISR